MQKILIANRGEIAVRVIRACAEAGYTSVAVYADQDIDAMHVRLADEAHALPGTSAAQTYLDMDALLAAAKRSGADAVHPGYGFLSESAQFASAVEQAGLIWIGPTPASITRLGDKVASRQLAVQVGAPLAAGTDEPLNDADEAVAFAREHGLPVVIKAAHGGGGRGLKIAHALEDVASAFDSATRESIAAFGRGECFIERYLEHPRHVEAQVLGDGRGRVIVVGDRDCSLQRRSQKLVEEAPAPSLTEAQRARIHDAARDICSAVDYRSAGTVEFLLAPDGTISFLEVNTRLQVEHPITEAVTGVDLVQEQFRIAEGRGMSFDETPPAVGHAFEFRLNAEDPGRGFLPSPGTIETLHAPGGPGIRWDAGVQAGDRVEAAFDSLTAKLIVHAPTRDDALARSRQALRELSIEGVATVAQFAQAVLDEPDFQTDSFAVSTQWIEQRLMPRLELQPRSAAGNGGELRRVAIELDGRRVMLGLPSDLLRGASADARTAADPAEGVPQTPADDRSVASPVPGMVASWLVADGASVDEGDDIAVIDAMKMETRVAAHRAGVIQHLVSEGDSVPAEQPIARVGEAD
ncbi:acetyl/propionyl/methylcrotonyl-CoA carboxylase subunit alpha [Agrococcus casei]|uniref:biotin carboxylase n=1 Tax=Agrococcus casei LMG 22410 TaxID=1255656 RepID=A0A1R4FRA7_9MICO|nr:biotin carboxylase N-terminal domain-containing protein [Agrococcus casei]SJM58466.1 Biotin carboxylase of acetyl-CoA carboxylase / Biotin carboxyl carrier protein of acetyl-CoA carboxylase [Agrococcus casei LMG 22410]